MVLYPSEEWLDEYCRAINESGELQDFAFSENILLVVTDLHLDDLTIGDLSDQMLGDASDGVREGLADMTLSEALEHVDDEIRESLPAPVQQLLEQTERDVIDGEIYVHIELNAGSCAGMELVTNPGDLEVDSMFRAPASIWQSIVAGRRPAIATALSGDVEVIGNAFKRVKYLAELQLLCDIAAEDVDSEFIFEHQTRPLPEFVFDESLRPSIELQKWMTREAALLFRPFTPF